MSEVTILGASGMLGQACSALLPDAYKPNRLEFDALSDDPDFSGWVINCIGAIPQKVSDYEVMKKLNSDFPKKLSNSHSKVIQIATDCVFSGKIGRYTESSPKDPIDDYGNTKWEGEQTTSMKIRCSVIGPDLKPGSLFEWIRKQPIGAVIHGYSDHMWNGVSTNVFAKLAKGIIETDFWQDHTYHLVPANFVSKYELVKLIAQRTNRSDLQIIKKSTGNKVDRTLATIYTEVNQKLWELAGYSEIPTIQEIVEEIPL